MTTLPSTFKSFVYKNNKILPKLFFDIPNRTLTTLLSNHSVAPTLLQSQRLSNNNNNDTHHQHAISLTTTTTTTTTRNFSSSLKSKHHTHCVELVQTRDRDGYLCGLLLPSHAKQSYFAIRAFNVEIAGIKDTMKQTHGGIAADDDSGVSLTTRMRMQWWREALDDIFNEENTKRNEAVKHHPVVVALKHAVKEKNLTRRFLERMLDAREAGLEVKQFGTVQEMLDYGEETVSSLLYLTLECVEVRDSTADMAASHIGVATSLVTALRSTIHHATRNEISLPSDLISQHSLPTNYLLRPPPSKEEMTTQQQQSDKALRNIVFDMSYIARAHLNEARELQHQIPKEGRVCLLPAVGTALYLKELERKQWNVLDPELMEAEKGLGLVLQIGRAWLTGIF